MQTGSWAPRKRPLLPPLPPRRPVHRLHLLHQPEGRLQRRDLGLRPAVGPLPLRRLQLPQRAAGHLPPGGPLGRRRLALLRDLRQRDAVHAGGGRLRSPRGVPEQLRGAHLGHPDPHRAARMQRRLSAAQPTGTSGSATLACSAVTARPADPAAWAGSSACAPVAAAVTTATLPEPDQHCHVLIAHQDL